MLKILFNILYTIWLVVNIIDIMQMFPLDSNVVFTMCLATWRYVFEYVYTMLTDTIKLELKVDWYTISSFR